MTEGDWLACEDPDPMLDFLSGGDLPTARKARLFAVAACRRVWHLMPDDRCRKAVEAAERFADGQVGRKELDSARAAVRHFSSGIVGRGDAGWAAGSAARQAAGLQRHYSTRHAAREARWAGQGEGVVQATLLRDILGPLPFRPIRLDPRLRTTLVLSLAQAAYHERVAPDPSRPGWLTLDPARPAVLADALEDTRASAELVAHLRGPGEHVRGCFALDLLLRKE